MKRRDDGLIVPEGFVLPDTDGARVAAASMARKREEEQAEAMRVFTAPPRWLRRQMVREAKRVGRHEAKKRGDTKRRQREAARKKAAPLTGLPGGVVIMKAETDE